MYIFSLCCVDMFCWYIYYLYMIILSIGVGSPSSARSRFDVIRWDYFSETEIYPENEIMNKKQLSGIIRETFM